MKQPGSYFEIAELITKLLEGNLSEDESEKLEGWIAESEKHRQIYQQMTDPLYLKRRLQYWNNSDPDTHWEALKTKLSDRPSTWRIAFRRSLRYAAVVIPLLFILGVGWHFLKNNKKKNHQIDQILTSANIHIFPKGKTAKLIMGNGKTVQLTDSLKEAFTEKDGTKVSNQGSTLHYLADNNKEDKVIFNTLITPRGGEYQIVLADGTKVWLNAASSLRFPVQFNSKERKVYLSGEAYFEVAKDEQHPFVVNTGKMDVTVLGTKFDISAYANDPKQITTLAEGSVRINNSIEDDNSVMLKPGYEAVISGSNNEIQINKANIKAKLAWKDGLFIFVSEPLGQIMRTLSRWYDVEVKYGEGVDTLLHFTGRIRKYENITGILEKLEMTKKIQFNVKGKEVIVTPYQKKINNEQKILAFE